MTPTEKIQNTIKTARTPPAPPKKRKLLSGIEGVGNNILLAALQLVQRLMRLAYRKKVARY